MMQREFDIVIKGGVLYDGSGSEPFEADIGISGGLIAAIGRIDEKRGGLQIPARGLAVSPGFIDSHAHSDFTLLADGRAEGKICQGVTTEINGNCGMSGAPLYGKAAERREEDLKELGIRERWGSVVEYRGLLERQGMALNSAMLIGHGNIRGSVVGYDDREPSLQELQEMRQLLGSSLKQGGSGLSTGLIYPPGIYSRTEELAELSKEVSAVGGIYTSHMRSEGDGLLESLQETLEIGRRAAAKIHISHIKTAGERNWQKADVAIAAIHEARLDGQRVTCDRYPYIASSTDLDSILPAWAFEGGNEAELARLADGETSGRLRAELLAQGGAYWQRVIVSSVGSAGNAWMEGLTVAEISRRLGLDEISAVFSILIREKLRVGAIFLSMCEENLRKFLSLPYCSIGSDSSARSFDGPTRLGKPHPRTFGTFPRFLGRYVRQEHLMPLQEAIHRSTALPAGIFGLTGRGMIREGYHADLVVFDPDRILDGATFENPFRKPEGIASVLVNGTPVLREGEPTGMRPGRFLGH